MKLHWDGWIISGPCADLRGGHNAMDVSVKGRNSATAQLATAILADIRSPGKSALVESII